MKHHLNLPRSINPKLSLELRNEDGAVIRVWNLNAWVFVDGSIGIDKPNKDVGYSVMDTEITDMIGDELDERIFKNER